MKSVDEIEVMLVNELWNNFDTIKSLKQEVDYYNDMLGDTSFLLAGLLGALLKFEDKWDSKKWLDDSLLTNIRLNKNKLSICGVMIWGLENTTKQWTDPFSFKVDLGDTKSEFNEYTFMFGDLNKREISYEEFRINRNYWGQTERDWKYIIFRNMS